jgi:two-component system phosphate regulon response regulator PhoB
MEGALSSLVEEGTVGPGSGFAPAECEVHVMLVESDSEPAVGLHHKLAQAGFKVSAVSYLKNPSDAVEREQPHLVMVDWDLPGMFTTDLVRRLRSLAIIGGPRVIALSSFAGEQHVVSGFELGVDDYVIKPYSVAEVIARVRAVLRPTLRQDVASNYLQFGELRMDTAEGRLTIEDSIIGLRHMEFTLLEFLMRRPERVHSRELLRRRVWGSDSRASLRAVDVTVQRVRRALAAHRCGNYLQTVRGIGYRLSANR